MIGRIRGTLLELEGSLATIEAGGVGYEVQLPESVLYQLATPGEPVDLYVRQIFREDGVALYGFNESFQRRIFDLLISVKGCGPKVGLALLGQVGPDTVVSATISQDPKPLTRANGVGLRLAERIILELREKIQDEALLRRVAVTDRPSPRKSEPGDELTEALVALGYRRMEAETAANTAREEAESVEDQLRIALRSLRK